MKKSIKFSAMLLASLTLSSAILPGAASVYANTVEQTPPSVVSTSDIPEVRLSDLDAEQNRKLNLMMTLGEDLELTSEGQINLKISISELESKYGLSQEDTNFVIESIRNYNKVLSEPVYMTRASFSGGYIHLTYDEVLNIVNLAASYGPGVIAGVMSTLLSFYPGIGTVIGGVIGWFGAAAILQAMSDAAFNKKGIKIGIGGISAE